jgi:hypothetical protein
VLTVAFLINLSGVEMPPKPVFPFGDDGHMIICQLAFDALSASARDEVRRLTRLYRRPDGYRYPTFAAACTFPDRARREAQSGNEGWGYHNRFSSWHYLNVPRETRRIEPDDCERACVLTGISYHAARVRDDALEDWRRAEAMFYLGHWVGDVHQPLHVSYRDDQGGNRIRERGFYDRTLHSIWDTGIIRESDGYTRWRRLAISLAASMPGSGSDDPLVWAQESYDIATLSAVEYCRWSDSGGTEACVSRGTSRRFDAGYQAEFEDDVYLRLQLAAVRLAEMLESLLSS